MRSHPSLAIIALITGTALAALPSTGAPKKPKATPAKASKSATSARDNTAIYEAVLLNSWIPRNYKIYATLGGKTPDAAFIKRMSSQRILLWNVRAPQTTKGQSPPLQINVSQPTWLSNSKVKVTWNDAGSGSAFKMEKKNGKWTVTERKSLWVRKR